MGFLAKDNLPGTKKTNMLAFVQVVAKKGKFSFNVKILYS